MTVGIEKIKKGYRLLEVFIMAKNNENTEDFIAFAAKAGLSNKAAGKIIKSVVSK